jgi:hypothetical protein
MLAHSPPFPLIIQYKVGVHARVHVLTGEDEEGLTLALQHRDRVCHIALRMPTPSLQKVITAIDDEFRILEYLYLAAPTKHNTLFFFFFFGIGLLSLNP